MIIPTLLTLTATILFFAKSKPTKIINIITAMILLQTFVFIVVMSLTDYSLGKTILISSGYSSFILFTYTLHIGPLARLTKYKIFKKSLAIRRDLGVSVFILSLYHYLLNWSLNFGWDFKTLQSIVYSGSNYGKGIQIALPAFMILTIVALISNQWSIKKVGRKIWKYLQLLVYPAYVLIGLHILLLGSIFNQYQLLQIIVLLVFISTWVIKVADICKTYSKKKAKTSNG
jgi:methionine sulfoxide reductase heme-binding subunit